ncbi:hypothetical protein ISCGN_000467 [Ixodes scapularis]
MLMWLVDCVFVCTEKIWREWRVVEKEEVEGSLEVTEQDKRAGSGGRKNRPATIGVVGTASVRRPQTQAWSAGLRGCPAATSGRTLQATPSSTTQPQRANLPGIKTSACQP